MDEFQNNAEYSQTRKGVHQTLYLYKTLENARSFLLVETGSVELIL